MTQHPLWWVWNVSGFSVCYYIKITWEVSCSNFDQKMVIPNFLGHFYQSMMLSTWRCITLTSLCFGNVCVATFTASNSRILILVFLGLTKSSCWYTVAGCPNSFLIICLYENLCRRLNWWWDIEGILICYPSL